MGLAEGTGEGGMGSGTLIPVIPDICWRKFRDDRDGDCGPKFRIKPGEAELEDCRVG